MALIFYLKPRGTLTQDNSKQEQLRQIDVVRSNYALLQHVSPLQAWELISTGKRDGPLLAAGERVLLHKY